MRSSPLLALTAGLFLLGLSASAQTTGDDAVFAEAMRLDSLGKHEQSLKLLDGLKDDPTRRVRVLQAIASCEFSHLHRLEDAFAHMQQAITADPKNASSYIDRSSMYQDVGMPERSLDDLKVALNLADSAKTKVATLMNMGAAYLQMHQPAKALEQLDIALAIDSTNVDVLLNKSSALDDLGRREESLAILEKLTAMDPANTAYMNNIGFLLANMERHAEAVSWFDRSLAIKKDDPYALNNRGYSKLRMGDKEGALKDVQRSIKLYALNAFAYRNLGLIYQDLKETDKACDAFEQALAHDFTKMYGDEVKRIHDSYCH